MLHQQLSRENDLWVFLRLDICCAKDSVLPLAVFSRVHIGCIFVSLVERFSSKNMRPRRRRLGEWTMLGCSNKEGCSCQKRCLMGFRDYVTLVWCARSSSDYTRVEKFR